MIVLSHISHHTMKYKVSENGTELIVTIEDKFNTATRYIDPTITTATALIDDPESKAMNLLFNEPVGPMTCTIQLRKAVATNPAKRSVPGPDGKTVRTIILLTVRKDDHDADSMESL